MSDIDAEKHKKESPEESSFNEFETMSLNTPKARDSKIIPRDVAKTDPSVEKAVYQEKKTEKKVEKKAEKKTEKRTEKKTEKKAEKKTEKKTDTTNSSESGKSNSAKKSEPKKLTAKEYKEEEIAKAVKNATKLPSTPKESSKLKEFGWKRVILATACALTALFGIIYVINLTSTDMSLQVAAMQSGIKASYPSFVPRGYTLSDVTSESGKVSMNFKSEEGMFKISEESSNWDSSALLNNYIKDTYGDDYTVVREQGLTLYMGNNWEAWVNGGVLYKLDVASGTLTKKQMKSIATSL